MFCKESWSQFKRLDATTNARMPAPHANTMYYATLVLNSSNNSEELSKRLADSNISVSA